MPLLVPLAAAWLAGILAASVGGWPVAWGGWQVVPALVALAAGLLICVSGRGRQSRGLALALPALAFLAGMGSATRAVERDARAPPAGVARLTGVVDRIEHRHDGTHADVVVEEGETLAGGE